MLIDGDRLVPDLIVYGGTVRTVDDALPVAEAVAVADGRIVAIGGSAEIKRLAGGGTRRLDLHGATLIPGLIDNHTHQLLAGMDTADAGVKANISTCTSIAEIARVIGDAAARAQPDAWITTSCLYRGSIKEQRFPTRHDLDLVAPDNPVYIADGGRNIIVNTRALQLAGITTDTPDPGENPDVSEGHIVRDDHGEPTGHLIVGAGDLARRRWWERLGQPFKMWDLLGYDVETHARGLKAQMQVFNAAGITGTREMGLNVDEIDAYVTLVSRGEATVRTDLILGLPAHHLSTNDVVRALELYFGPKQGFGGDWLRVGGIKIVAQNYGWWTLQPDKLRTLILETNRRGWTLAIHGTPPEMSGDIEVILDALEEANREVPLAGRRWSYEHCFGLTQADYIERLKQLDLIIACNPLLSYFAAGRSLQMHEAMEQVRIAKSASELTPRERVVREWAQPVRTWMNAGLTVTAGTDCPAVTYDPDRPLLGMWASFSQETLAGVLMPEEKVSAEQALRMWTINGAYASFEEHRRGSISVGKAADMVVLSDDPITSPRERFLDIKVLETIVDGRTVHERAPV
jgi:predicted amidohydrolase YtcJ